MKIEKFYIDKYTGLNKYIFIAKDPEIYKSEDADVAGIARQELKNSLSRKYDYCFLNQIHSNEAVITEKPFLLGKEPQVDGVVTKATNLALCIQTADCVPILFSDKELGVIGACHAGWKGAKNGIIESTIKQMQELGVKNIEAEIGPHIRQNSYEVNNQYYAEFLSDAEENGKYFVKSKKDGHYLFDLTGFVKDKLLAQNIKHILDVNLDTYADENRFFSYRKATHQGRKLDGNILSVIVISQQ